jgi:hypothetical protein
MMAMKLDFRPIIQPCAAHCAIIKTKPRHADNMQRHTRRRAKTRNIARIRGYFRLDQSNAKHKKPCWVTGDREMLSPVTCYDLPVTSFVVIVQPDDVVFAQIVAELDFDEEKRSLSRVAEAMVGFRWNVYVLALMKL